LAPRTRLTHEFTLESAHSLPRLAESHKCRRVHGHSFVIEVQVEGEIDPAMGWLIDYADLQKSFEPVHGALDHRLLNEVEGLENPTSENLAVWIWKRLKPSLPMLTEIVVHETCQARCGYRGE
jgi:6-pyruvoyltetrahydropterin/6-carboxytetrahydropterin synthase